jgi:uncharacterized SAM-binding protein YcdF (DUF218 family)
MLTDESISATRYFIIFIAGLFALLYYAPAFLIYSDSPAKSDAIVLFVGADSNRRNQEVQMLLFEGYADYQIVPAYRKIQAAVSLTSDAPPPAIKPQQPKSLLQIKRYFENTHIEVLEARRMMEQYGFKTAVFVSSPYHMRRIKIMSDKVFSDPSYSIAFVPARLEPARESWFTLTRADLKFIAREYVKIAWFLIYSRFMI